MITAQEKTLATPDPNHFVERINGAQDLYLYRDHMGRYRFALQWAPNSRILDLCCGVGYGSFLLAAGGAKQVLGLDISEEAIAAARSQPALPNLSYDTADACKPLSNPGQWDLVTCFEGVEHVPDPKALIKNVYDALAPGGIALISTPNGDAYEGGHSGNPFHLEEMSEAKFRSVIGSHAWKTEYYAQNGGWIWARPRWQYMLLPFVRLFKGQPKPHPVQSKQGDSPSYVGISETSDMAAALNTEEGYLMPWHRAKAVSKIPPQVIVALCWKPGNRHGHIRRQA